MNTSTNEPRTDLAALTAEQLSDALAAIDAQQILDDKKTIDLGKSARYYAEHYHWPVFPLQPRGKKPLTQHGFKDATLDVNTIVSWWMRWPDANIGTPTGPDEDGGCGLDVIDVDGIEGHRSIAAIKHALCAPDCCQEVFCDSLGDLPPVRALAYTPGGPGRHYFIDATGDGNSSRYEPGLDYRGAGGYVVIAPSLGLSGHRYTWLQRPELPR